jgi:hypothetical protein
MCLRLALAGLAGLESPNLPAAATGNAIPVGSGPSQPGSTAAGGDASTAAWAACVQQYPFLGSDADR